MFDDDLGPILGSQPIGDAGSFQNNDPSLLQGLLGQADDPRRNQIVASLGAGLAGAANNWNKPALAAAAGGAGAALQGQAQAQQQQDVNQQKILNALIRAYRVGDMRTFQQLHGMLTNPPAAPANATTMTGAPPAVARSTVPPAAPNGPAPAPANPFDRPPVVYGSTAPQDNGPASFNSRFAPVQPGSPPPAPHTDALPAAPTGAPIAMLRDQAQTPDASGDATSGQIPPPGQRKVGTVYANGYGQKATWTDGGWELV